MDVSLLRNLTPLLRGMSRLVYATNWNSRSGASAMQSRTRHLSKHYIQPLATSSLRQSQRLQLFPASSTALRAAAPKSASVCKPRFASSIWDKRLQLASRLLGALKGLTSFSPCSEFVPCKRTTTGTLKGPNSAAAPIIDSAIISHRMIPGTIPINTNQSQSIFNTTHLHRY